jgi:hypothetical protein
VFLAVPLWVSGMEFPMEMMFRKVEAMANPSSFDVEIHSASASASAKFFSFSTKAWPMAIPLPQTAHVFFLARLSATEMAIPSPAASPILLESALELVISFL